MADAWTVIVVRCSLRGEVLRPDGSEALEAGGTQWPYLRRWALWVSILPKDLWRKPAPDL